MNIYEKMLAITNEIGTINKNLIVGFGSNKYKAVGEADVLKAVRQLELKYGVYSYPSNRRITESNVMTVKNAKGEEKTNLFMRLEVTYTFINVEKPEEKIDVTTYGDGIDSQDKAPGKAMTYADKYALLKAYKIVTGDDPDQEASGELKQNTIDNIKQQTLIQMVTDKQLPTEQIVLILNKCGYKKVADIREEDFKKVYEAIKEA